MFIVVLCEEEKIKDFTTNIETGKTWNLKRISRIAASTIGTIFKSYKAKKKGNICHKYEKIMATTHCEYKQEKPWCYKQREERKLWGIANDHICLINEN